MSDARQYAVWPHQRASSRSRALENWPFSKAISSAIYNGSWQLTTDSETNAQYLNLIGPDFDHICPSFCVM